MVRDDVEKIKGEESIIKNNSNKNEARDNDETDVDKKTRKYLI